MLDGDTLPPGAVEAMREGLKELDEERESADPLAATTREVLGQLEAADLPLPVLTRALDEIRMSQSGGREAVAVLLERLRLVLDFPWSARAGERVDIEAAMAELDAAHAGRAAVKERVRRFLATRQPTSTTWTLEGLSHGDRCRGGDGSAPAALRRLVVRPARSAARAPVLCFVAPPGGGKTTLAKLIARALGRPGVLVALGGVWDESAVRGRPISFRSPMAGRVVLGLRKAKVRNPVMILDEVDKENWDYRISTSPRPFPILKSFIFYTFARLEAEGKIAGHASPKTTKLSEGGHSDGRRDRAHSDPARMREPAGHEVPWWAPSPGERPVSLPRVAAVCRQSTFTTG